MACFLYVFSKNERDALLSLNYTLIKSDDTKNIYVFENDESLRFDSDKVKAVYSDTLTF